MSLTLSTSFVAKTNSVLPLAQSLQGLAVRVASNASDILGVLTASSAQNPSVAWVLQQNPTWIGLTVDTTTLIATITFSNAVAQAHPYQFFVTATDGVTTVNFPIFLEVKPPFSLVSTSGATNFSVPSYDSTVADIVLQGVGLGGQVDSGVQFMLPPTLPVGMKYITSDGSSMKLRVSEPSSTNISGGISTYQGSPVSTQVMVSAYNPGTFYDTPARCFTQALTIDSLTAKQGVVDLGLTVQYNTSTNAFQLNSFLDFLQGEPQAVTYQWIVTGTATGGITAGGTASSSSMTWTPSTAGTVGFKLNVLSATGQIIGQTIVTPFPCAVSGGWASTNAIKLSFSGIDQRGYVGDTPTLTVSTPPSELGTNETITVNLAVATGSSLETVPTLTNTLVTLTANSPTAAIGLTIPNSGFNSKFIITASAENSTSAPTRTGFAQVVFLSNGGQPITISSLAGTSLTSNVGQAIVPIPLIAANNAGVILSGVTFSLCGAPDGLYINSGALTGNVLQPGVYTFQYVAELTGYARSYSGTITLTAAAYATPLTITNAVPSVASLPDNTQFNVTWGYSGTPLTMNMIQGYTVRNVLGSTQAATSEVGSSVITIYGSSFYGPAYSIPALVISSSTIALGPLVESPTMAVIDENYNLDVYWNPLTVNGSYQAYKAWNIYLKLLPNGLDTLQYVNNVLPTGLTQGGTPDSRFFTTVLTAGDWQMHMQALTANVAIAANGVGWDNPHAFPTAITSSLVSFDNNTISLGQTLTITLNTNYIGADQWQAVFPDGSTSGWMPISVKTIAKTFTTAGSFTVVIQTKRDYSSANPPVRLLRQVSLPIFVMNQPYVSPSQTTALTGTLGIGGSAGFEITDASQSSVPLVPYEVMVRALVRDTLTNELKLMIATSRTPNASSLLGTMAIDVFPIAGRPRVKDLLDFGLYLTPEQASANNPVKIATTALPSVIVGKPMSDFPMQVTANTGVAPFSWYADGLPYGLKLSSNGTLSGTALTINQYEVAFTVMDSNVPPFIANTTLPLNVVSDLAITSTTMPQAVVNVPYSNPILNSGGIPPLTWSIVSGTPPTGLTVNPLSGYLVGTPATYNSTTDFVKTFTFAVQAVDAIGAIASASLSMTLAPAPLQFGFLDQHVIFANQNFELTVPVFGGTSPYTLASFTDDGTIGSGLQLVSPQTVAVVAGVQPSVLTITTPNQVYYPQVYPYAVNFPLTATGGVAPYRFALGTTAIATNLLTTNAAVFGQFLVADISADGLYQAYVQCTDAIGETTSQLISITVQQQNSGAYAIKPVQINTGGSSNPASWSITPLTALPDALTGVNYTGGVNILYGVALYQSGVLHITQAYGTVPMSFNLISGSLPPGITAFSGNYNNPSTDYSGIQIFNLSGSQSSSTNGNYSFEVGFSNIITATGAAASCVSRASITVSGYAGGPTPVVSLTSTQSTAVSPYTVDLATAVGYPYYTWFLPLTAESTVSSLGSGPYTYSIGSGSTLPGAVIRGGFTDNLPCLVSANTTTGLYNAIITATDAYGHSSTPFTVYINLLRSTTHPITIIAVNQPNYVYANQPIAANTYYLEASTPANWAVSGFPAGVSLTSTGTYTYLTGTPTTSGTYNGTVTAVSTVYGSSVSVPYTVVVRAQSAVFINAPTSAVVSQSYRAVNNNAIISVQYVGWQPNSPGLPLVSSLHGTIGAPGVNNAGSPTTSVSNLTSDGFILSYDYSCSVVGNDVLSLPSGTSISLPVTYTPITATGQTVSSTVSEYSTTVSLAAPVTVTGGQAPYTITISGLSDSRFTAAGNQAQVSIPTLTVGQTTTCNVAMLIVDSSGTSVTATGVLQLYVRQETYITVNYANVAWGVTIANAPFTSYILPNIKGSVPVLGHAPYQYFVDSVTIPTALAGFVQVSPTKRVLAIQCNANATSAVISDANSSLQSSSSYTVAAVNPTLAPAAGVYQIPVTLRVVDSEALSSTQIVNVILTIS